MIENKVRRFKVGEFLNTCFSAREFGLALASDIIDALEEFPDRTDMGGKEGYDIWSVEGWLDQWFSDFIEKGEKE